MGEIITYKLLLLLFAMVAAFLAYRWSDERERANRLELRLRGVEASLRTCKRTLKWTCKRENVDAGCSR